MPEIQPVPMPPLGAEEISTACDYCVVGCSYRVWRWKVGAGGTANTAVPWANPSQHNIVQWQGEPHHVLVLPDPQARAVNPMGNHSMRGGTLAQKCYNPENKTRERLTTPLLRSSALAVGAISKPCSTVLTEVAIAWQRALKAIQSCRHGRWRLVWQRNVNGAGAAYSFFVPSTTMRLFRMTCRTG